jgi:chromosome partitioning protein
MDVVSVINYKGGVGKTTTTANIAAQLAWTGKNVLLIDLDPQASLTFSFIRPEDWETNLADERTIKRWFDTVGEGDEINMNDLMFERMRVNEVLRDKGRLTLIPSHLGLINVDLELATQLGGANMTQVKRNYVRVHRRLAKGLAEIDQDAFDVVLIDCPPNFNIVTKTAIVASSQVLVPAKPDYLSTLGITYLQRNLNQLVSDFNEYAAVEGGNAVEQIDPQILGVIFTMVQYYREKPIQAHRGYMRQIR